MYRNILYFFIIIGMLFISFGSYITIVSKENSSKVPVWITNNLVLIKAIGPIIIGIGLLLFIVSICAVYYDSLDNTNLVNTTNTGSKFGFKFY